MLELLTRALSVVCASSPLSRRHLQETGRPGWLAGGSGTTLHALITSSYEPTRTSASNRKKTRRRIASKENDSKSPLNSSELLAPSPCAYYYVLLQYCVRHPARHPRDTLETRKRRDNNTLRGGKGLKKGNGDPLKGQLYYSALEGRMGHLSSMYPVSLHLFFPFVQRTSVPSSSRNPAALRA